MTIPPYRYAGGVAVLTGAASGIGREVALQLAARGSHLALIDHDEAGLRAIAEAIQQVHPDLRVSRHPFDLSCTADIPALAEEVLRAQRRVTLLINNAGIALGGTFEQVSLEQFEQVQAVNFRAPIAMTKAFLPALRAELYPHLVNVSSVFGLIGPPGQSAYSASKFAVRGFSEVLWHELAPRGIGVTVVHPGGVRTNIAHNAMVAPGTSAAEVEAGRRAMNKALRLDPVIAALIILRAVEGRSPRVLVGTDARLLDLLARALPGTYGRVLATLMTRSAGP